MGGGALFVVLSAGYFTLGSVMVLRYNFFDLDGPSRVANAGFALLSSDPHLSAIGFVWNPLPSLVELPFVGLSQWWPELRTEGLAGVAQSALFMAGAALFVRTIAADQGLAPGWRWLAVLTFALHPVIVIYAASGMSEGAEIFCTLWATRHVIVWVRTQAISALAWAGIAIGIGYLARYDVAFCAVGTALLVAVVSLTHGAEDNQAHRRSTVVLNVLIVSFPFLTTFALWAITGWITSGDLFATLSSNYGNTGQIETALSRGVDAERSGNANAAVVAARLLAMQPFVGLAVVLAVSMSVLRKNFDALVPTVMFGSVLVFAVWGQLTGTTFGWFRFYILAIPLVIVVALTCWTPVAEDRPGSLARYWSAPGLATKAGATLLCVSVLIAIPVTTKSMLRPDIGNQNLQFGLRAFLDPRGYPPDEQWYRRLRNDDRTIADYLDAKHLPSQSVLMDSFVGWGIWLASDDPRQFIITSDYDFKAALNRPWDFGVEYIIVSNASNNDAPDAVNLRYPQLWSTGAGFGQLVYAASGATGRERWRIFRVLKAPGQELDKGGQGP